MTQARPPALVFTDLDGSLLGHHDYAIEGAMPGLDHCRRHRIPVVPNTSKTRAEVLPLLSQLSLPWAAIVENGSAIVLPEDSAWAECIPATERCLGMVRAEIQTHLADLRAQTGARCLAFSDMRLAQIVDLTGLPEAAARLASMREYSEPLHWQDSEAALEAFAQAARERGLQCLRGGRFVHLLGQTDKGLAARRVMATLGWSDVTMIAFGDAPNDAAMMAAADIGVWVKPQGGPCPKTRARQYTIHTSRPAPDGWTEGLIAALAASHGEDRVPPPAAAPETL